jgi:DNA-binding transcriptional regulator YiaG
MTVVQRKKRKTLKTGRASAERAVVLQKTKSQPAVVELRRELQLTQPEFARLVPISVRSLATLESGSTPSDAVARRVTELKRLMKALSEVIRRESLGHWLTTPNRAFDDLKPLEVIERGESDRLWQMVYLLRSGVAS